MRYVIFQVWDFEGEVYDLAMYFVVDDGGDRPRPTSCGRSIMRSARGACWS